MAPVCITQCPSICTLTISEPFNLPTVQKNFVHVIRAVELTLGIPVPWELSVSVSASDSNNFTAALSASATTFSAEVQAALLDAVPILIEIGAACGLQTILEASPFKSFRTSLVAK
jgi:hypothetical protein